MESFLESMLPAAGVPELSVSSGWTRTVARCCAIVRSATQRKDAASSSAITAYCSTYYSVLPVTSIGFHAIARKECSRPIAARPAKHTVRSWSGRAERGARGRQRQACPPAVVLCEIICVGGFNSTSRWSWSILDSGVVSHTGRGRVVNVIAR